MSDSKSPYISVVDPGNPSSLQGQKFDLDGSDVTIGTSVTSTISLPLGVAEAEHARVFFENGRWHILNLSAKHKMYIEGIVARHHQFRQDGEFFTIGKAQFRFFLGEGEASNHNDLLYKASMTDPLTKLYNRRAYEYFLEREMALCTTHAQGLSLVLLDADHFHDKNETYGHDGGDVILKELTSRLSLQLRKEEILARIGGEEFALILPKTSQKNALDVAERLRMRVADIPFVVKGQEVLVTFSAGVASTLVPVDIADLYREADALLQWAKDSGRNNVKG